MRILLSAVLVFGVSLQLAASEKKNKNGKRDNSPSTPAESASAADFERYKVLTQRNIFSKDRKTKDDTKSADAKEKEAPPVKPESELILSGIIEKDGQLVAFIENSKTGAMQTLRKGDAIARGKIASMTLDSLEYKPDEGEGNSVTIGKNFEGVIVAKAAPVSKPADGGSPEMNSIMEKMRKRRMEEMKK